jgi:hypothetical protein
MTPTARSFWPASGEDAEANLIPAPLISEPAGRSTDIAALHTASREVDPARGRMSWSITQPPTNPAMADDDMAAAKRAW